MRTIYCQGCKKYVGKIRDAKLLKNIVFLCPKCEIKRKSAILKTTYNPYSSVPFFEIFRL